VVSGLGISLDGLRANRALIGFAEIIEREESLVAGFAEVIEGKEFWLRGPATIRIV
jgi:hypothetical protein